MTTAAMAAMSAGETHEAAEVLRAVARHLNCLNEDSKSTRKRALESIRRETLDARLSSSVLQEVFACLLKSLLKCLSDPMERCREVAIRMLFEFIRGVPQPERSLAYLIPTLSQRLAGKELMEPAEELRLALLELLGLTVEVCGLTLAPYLDDVMSILQRTIVDPFPEVKKESCRCSVNLAACLPEHFHMQSEALVKPLMQTISHRHCRVRVAAVEATGIVVQHSNGKILDDVLSHLAQRLFDDSPQVRKAVTSVVGGWLLHLADRYSYFHKLIPLLLTSLTDDIPEIRDLAADLWKKTGAQWEKENEEDLKDKLDFLTTPPTLYPARVERPRLGCRELVVRNLGRLLPAISREVTDWLEGTRIKAAQLLTVLMLHVEDHITQHLPLILSTLYHACAHSEAALITSSQESAKLIGTFVNPEIYLDLLLTHVEDPSLISPSSWAPLMILASVLRGSTAHTLRSHLTRITDTLAHPDLCQMYQQGEYLEQLLSCVRALVQVAGQDCGTVSLQLLQVLVTVQSSSNEQTLHTEVQDVLGFLCGALDLPGETDLFRQHMAALLTWFTQTQESWSSYSVQRRQLETVLVHAGPVIGEFLPQLLPLLLGLLQPSRDLEMRLQLFILLTKLLLDAPNTLDSQGSFRDHLDAFLQELLLPNLVWQPGRVAGAIRTAALSSLLALLDGKAVTAEQLLTVEEKLTPLILAALQEDAPMPRLMACRCFVTLLSLVGQQLSPESLNRIYPELLSRMDDGSREVRSAALKALGLWFSGLPGRYCPHTHQSHLQSLYRQLLTHMDDPDQETRLAVLDVLKASSSADPELLVQEVEAVKHKHRNPEHCDQLLQHISARDDCSQGC